MNKVWRWFENLVPPFPQADLQTPPSGFIKFIFYYTKGLWKFFIIISILTALMAAGEALFFTCLGLLVDWTANTNPVAFVPLYGKSLVFMLLLAGIILPLASTLHSLLLHQTISSNYPMQIRWRTHHYLLNQSLSFFSDEFAGRVATKVMQTSMAVRTCVLKLLDVLMHMSVYIVTMLLMLANADLLLTIPLLVWLVFYISSLVIFIPRLSQLSQKQADTRSEMVGRIVDSYVNIATVKLFGGKGRESRFAKDSMRKFMKSEYQALRSLTLFDISVQYMNYAMLISITMLSLWLWANYAVTTGAIAIAIAVAIRLINMSRWMMWEVGAIFENIGTVYDGIQTLSRPITVTDIDDKNAVHLKDVKGAIEFRNVFFAYNQDKMVLDNLSFKVEPGQKIGIVGRSGAGKSTLVNLLLRFYDVQKGEILLDGVNIKNIKQDELRDNFAMVSQDSSLLHRTVGQNITYGSDIDESKLNEALDISKSLSFIENLTDFRGRRGFDSLVGERGVKLSGGQRQRIALARVMIKNAPILILDEATASLDSESEKVILDSLESVMQGRTVFVIAHRLSTLSIMDKIIVLDKGRISQEGSHQELIEKDGLYKTLWQRQVNGFLPDGH